MKKAKKVSLAPIGGAPTLGRMARAGVSGAALWAASSQSRGGVMSSLSPISIEGYKPVAPPPAAPAPQLAWIKVEDLVVDRSYQREILSTGRANVQRIANGFNWAFFAPVIVSPVEGGKYAIIDGQHRTTAAALVGKDSVPCQIVIADVRDQARAFAAVNGNVTKLHALQIFHAAIKAGDAEAVSLNEIALRAGVRICSYPIARARQEPGDTMALRTLQKMRAVHVDELLGRALTALRSCGGELRGALTPEAIGAMCMVLARKLLSEQAVKAVFPHIILEKCIAEASRREGFSRAIDLRDVLAEKLASIAARGRAG